MLGILKTKQLGVRIADLETQKDMGHVLSILRDYMDIDEDELDYLFAVCNIECAKRVMELKKNDDEIIEV